MPANDTHRDMVLSVVHDLEARGFQAIAAHLDNESYPDTDRYAKLTGERWFHPDVQARSQDNRLFVYEVETEESLDAPETREKIEVLTNAAVKANGKFYLVVPQPLFDSAQRLLRDMNLEWGEVLGSAQGRMV